MTFVRTKARIFELSTTSGSGPFALAGAPDGSYNNFASVMSVGDTVHVTVVEPGVAFWSGLATYSAANELTLTTVEETKGIFGSGTKEVFATPLASSSALPFDIAGAIVTGGTSAAYTVASFRKYSTLAELDGSVIAFTPHASNGGAMTLDVDGLGAKPLRSSPGVELGSNVLIAGTPYLALYNHAAQAFHLHALGGNAYGIPLGAGMDYWGTTTPSSAFAFPTGQAISRTTYAGLFSLIGTTYGAGNGTSTFNLPDKRGRVSASADAMGGVAAGRLTDAVAGIDSLGDAGGAQTHTLTTTQIPSHTHANSLNESPHSHAQSFGYRGYSTSGSAQAYSSAPGVDGTASYPPAAASTGITITNAAAGGGGAHNNIQPTIVCNYIMRVL